jgi:hypothetical protein
MFIEGFYYYNGYIKTPYFIDISSKIGSLIQLILYFLFGQKVKQKAHHKNQIQIFLYAKSHAYRLKNLNFALFVDSSRTMLHWKWLL